MVNCFLKERGQQTRLFLSELIREKSSEALLLIFRFSILSLVRNLSLEFKYIVFLSGDHTIHVKTQRKAAIRKVHQRSTHSDSRVLRV